MEQKNKALTSLPTELDLMAHADAVAELIRHKNTLQAVLGRYVKTDRHISMSPADDPVYRQTVHEVVELLNEQLGSNRLSWQIEHEFSEGLANFFQTPSYKSVENIISVVGAAISKFSRLKSKDLLPDQSTGSQPSRGKSIFLSHSSSEADLARDVASWLEASFPQTRCFCSGRPADLPPGAARSRMVR